MPQPPSTLCFSFPFVCEKNIIKVLHLASPLLIESKKREKERVSTNTTGSNPLYFPYFLPYYFHLTPSKEISSSFLMIYWILKFMLSFASMTAWKLYCFFSYKRKRTWKSTEELFCHFLSERNFPAILFSKHCLSFIKRFILKFTSSFASSLIDLDESYCLIILLLLLSLSLKRRASGSEKDVISSLRQSQSSHAVFCPRLKFLWNEIKNYLDYSRSFPLRGYYSSFVRSS